VPRGQRSFATRADNSSENSFFEFPVAVRFTDEVDDLLYFLAKFRLQACVLEYLLSAAVCVDHELHMTAMFDEVAREVKGTFVVPACPQRDACGLK
jgi:hypothetical protein